MEGWKNRDSTVSDSPACVKHFTSSIVKQQLLLCVYCGLNFSLF